MDWCFIPTCLCDSVYGTSGKGNLLWILLINNMNKENQGWEMRVLTGTAKQEDNEIYVKYRDEVLAEFGKYLGCKNFTGEEKDGKKLYTLDDCPAPFAYEMIKWFLNKQNQQINKAVLEERGRIIKMIDGHIEITSGHTDADKIGNFLVVAYKKHLLNKINI